MALGPRQGEVLGLCSDDLNLATGSMQCIMVVRLQLQRVSWQHGCPDPEKCTTRAARSARQIWETGLNRGSVFATETGRPTNPRADGREFRERRATAKVPPK
jgi:hypothetical protein